MTLEELLPLAITIVRGIEDAGLSKEMPHVEALKIRREIESLIEEPPRLPEYAASYVRCCTPKLREWAADCARLGKAERARMYEAIVALRMLAAEACLAKRRH